MPITGTSIAQGIYEKLGRPSQADLPYSDVLNAARDVYRGRLFDMKLANRNHSLSLSSWYTPTATEGVNLTSFSIDSGHTLIFPVKVEWRPINAQSTYKPRKAEVVSFENISDYGRRALTDDETYVAFYNGNLVAFSETTSVLANREYRIIYENTEDVNFDQLADTITQIPELLAPLFYIEGALILLDQIRNDTPEWMDRRERLRENLTAQLMDWNERFRVWRGTLFGNKKVSKPGYRQARFR